MTNTIYTPLSGWTSNVISGQATLRAARSSREFQTELDAFESFRAKAEEDGVNWADSSLVNFEPGSLDADGSRLLNAGESLELQIADDPVSDEALIALLRSILAALAFTHEYLGKQGQDRGHGNVRPELIFESNLEGGSFVLGHLLNRVPPPFQTELNPTNAFVNQIPTHQGDLYALGMIALRYRLGNKLYAEAFSEIFEIEDPNERGSIWLSWHDGFEMHPSLEELDGAHPDLTVFVEKLLERKKERRFGTAREAYEEFEELAVGLGVAKPANVRAVQPAPKPEAQKESFGVWEEPEKKEKLKDKDLVNYLLMGLCACIAIIIGLVVFAPNMVRGIMGGEVVMPLAQDDAITLQVGDGTYYDCHLLNGGGDCNADTVASEKKSLEEFLYVSSVSLQTDDGVVTLESPPFAFGPSQGLADGVNVQISREGLVEVDPSGIRLEPGVKPLSYEFFYGVTLSKGGGQQQGQLSLDINVPNVAPIGTQDEIKIPLDVAPEVTETLLDNDVDADLENKPESWGFDEKLRILSVNGTAMDEEGVTLDLPDGDTTITVSKTGKLIFQNLPERLEDSRTVNFEYIVADYLGFESLPTKAVIELAKPNFVNSPPKPKADKFTLDLSTEALPANYNLFADNGDGEDVDTDMAQIFIDKGIEDSFSMTSLNGKEVRQEGLTPVAFESGLKLTAEPNGDILIVTAPDGLAFGREKTESFDYELTDSFDATATGRVTLSFVMSDDPDFVTLNDGWKMKVKGRPRSALFKQLDLSTLPSRDDCFDFGKKMTAEKQKKLTHSDYGYLGEFWIKDRNGPVVCLLTRTRAGQYEPKIKSDSSIKNSFSAYLAQREE